MVEVQLGAFDDIGELQDLVDRVVLAVCDQVHHQVVVRDAEVAEPAEAVEVASGDEAVGGHESSPVLRDRLALANAR